PRLRVKQIDIKLAIKKVTSGWAHANKNFIHNIRKTFLKHIPNYWPYYNNFVVDDKGRIWVGGSAHLNKEWRIWYIFNPRGELIKKVKLPLHFTVFQVRDGLIAGELLDKKSRSIVQIYYLHEE